MDGVGAEDRGVDLGHGVEKGLEPLLLVPLVGQKEALVFSGEGRPQPVLEEARAADDERHVAEVVEGDRQALDDLGREGRVLEDLDEMGVFLADDLDVLVLLLVDVVEVVVGREGDQRVGGDVPRLGLLDQADDLRPAGRLLEDAAGQEEAGALAAQLAVAAGGENDPLHEVEEVLDVDELLGDVDELELFGEEAPDQGDADAVGQGPGELDALGRQELEATHAVEDLG